MCVCLCLSLCVCVCVYPFQLRYDSQSMTGCLSVAVCLKGWQNVWVIWKTIGIDDTCISGVTTSSPEHFGYLRLVRFPVSICNKPYAQKWGHRWVNLLLLTHLVVSALLSHPYPRGRAQSFNLLLPGQPFYERPHGGHMCVSCSPHVCLPHPQSQLGRVNRGGHRMPGDSFMGAGPVGVGSG